MKSESQFFKRFSEEQLDQAECLIKRDNPELWTNMTRPTPSQMNNTNFYYEFLQMAKNLVFIGELGDVTALCYGLYNRAGKVS